MIIMNIDNKNENRVIIKYNITGKTKTLSLEKILNGK